MNSQKIISKKEEKKSSKSASLLLQLDRNKIQNRNKNKNLEILKKPRSKEYVRLVLAMESLGKEIEEVEKQIALAEPPKEKWWETKIPDKTQAAEAKEKLPVLQDRLQSLLTEYKYTVEQFMKEIPEPDRMLGFIYPTCNEQLLLRYGIISCSGDTVSSEEELIDCVEPDNKQAEEQWRKGYREYKKYMHQNLLLTEIYMDTVCCVFKNGETYVVE